MPELDEITLFDLNTRINVLEEQRNQALTQVVLLRAQLARAERQISELNQELTELKTDEAPTARESDA